MSKKGEKLPRSVMSFQRLRQKRIPMANGNSGKDRAWDIIGDVHGCYFELVSLLHRLGYKVSNHGNAINVQCPPGRYLGFTGDLIKRGPYSARVLALVMRAVRQGKAVCVPGNHDDELRHCLNGRPMQIGRQLNQALQQITHFAPDFRDQTQRFLQRQRCRYENHQLIIVHAVYKDGIFGGDAYNLAVQGKVWGGEEEEGWEQLYSGRKTVVHGHEAVPEPTITRNANGGCVVNVDTGCCIGGSLTALRFPEMDFVSVRAQKKYYSPR